MPPRPPADASMPFVFLGPGFRIQLPSDPTSRWTPLLFCSGFLSWRPPEGLAPSTSIPSSLSLAGYQRPSRRFAPCLAHKRRTPERNSGVLMVRDLGLEPMTQEFGIPCRCFRKLPLSIAFRVDKVYLDLSMRVSIQICPAAASPAEQGVRALPPQVVQGQIGGPAELLEAWLSRR